MVGTPSDEGFLTRRGFASSISDRSDRRDGDEGFGGGSFFGAAGRTGGKVTFAKSA